jgi:hypothetical protein
MDEQQNNVKEIGKSGRTKDSLRKAIEGELTEAKVKEVRGKLKQLIVDLAAAKKVVQAKEEEIESLFEDYADVIPE